MTQILQNGILRNMDDDVRGEVCFSPCKGGKGRHFTRTLFLLLMLISPYIYNREARIMNAINDTMQEILEFVRENDVKFIRLAFCDLFGVQKNIAIMAEELPKAFQYGIAFDGSAVAGYGTVERSDLFLVPDSSTASILPWRPEHDRVMRMYCTVKNPDGTDFLWDSRTILKKAVQRAAEEGFLCRVGTECEFYLLRTGESQQPTLTPMDHGSYGDVSPLDKGENIRRRICLALEAMGIQPESSHHEQGPGQNEIDFRYSDALTAADNFMSFKWLVKSIVASEDLFASFLPKPFLQHSGNGMHINLSLSQHGANLFRTGQQHSAVAESFIAGILKEIPGITAFLNPLTNSYRRFGQFEAPKYLTWSHQNRSQLIRIPASRGEYNRMELRSPDPSCNPYLAFALLLHAGLDGIREKQTLCPPCNENLYHADEYLRSHNIVSLPESLENALQLAEQSSLVKKVLGPALWTQYREGKEAEIAALQARNGSFSYEIDTYLPRI